jgi:hypothetical protein
MLSIQILYFARCCWGTKGIGKENYRNLWIIIQNITDDLYYVWYIVQACVYHRILSASLISTLCETGWRKRVSESGERFETQARASRHSLSLSQIHYHKWPIQPRTQNKILSVGTGVLKRWFNLKMSSLIYKFIFYSFSLCLSAIRIC